MEKKDLAAQPGIQHNTTNWTVKWNSHHHRKETNKCPKSRRKRMNIKSGFLQIIPVLLLDKSVSIYFFFFLPRLCIRNMNFHHRIQINLSTSHHQIALKGHPVTDDLWWPVTLTSLNFKGVNKAISLCYQQYLAELSWNCIQLGHFAKRWLLW